MAFDFDLPTFGAGDGVQDVWDPSSYTLTGDTSGSASAWDTENYNLMPESEGGFIDSLGGMFSSAMDTGSSVLGGVWDWANTDIGASTIGGGIAGLSALWSEDRKLDALKELELNKSHDALEIAKMKDERVKTHNASAAAPLNVSPRKFK